MSSELKNVVVFASFTVLGAMLGCFLGGVVGMVYHHPMAPYFFFAMIFSYELLKGLRLLYKKKGWIR